MPRLAKRKSIEINKTTEFEHIKSKTRKTIRKNKKGRITTITTMDDNINTPENNTPVLNNGNKPKNKRLREVLQNSMSESISKSPRLANAESPFKIITTVDKRFDKLTDDLTEKLQSIIQTMFRECEDRLLSEIDKRLNITMSDLNKVTDRVTNLESVVEEIRSAAMDQVNVLRTEAIDLKEEIAYLKSCARKHENSIVANDIRITNVPSEKNEDLYDIYFRLCEAVNINPPNVKTIYRVNINRYNKQDTNINNNNRARDAAIIIKFKCPYERNYVLKSITSFTKFRKDPLRLNLIGFKSSMPFYANENLTPENHRIFLKALSLKKQSIISAAFVNRGLVYIKQQNAEDSICISDFNQLNQLFRQCPDDRNIHECTNITLQNSRESL